MKFRLASLLVLLWISCSFAKSSPIVESQDSKELDDLNTIPRNSKQNGIDGLASTDKVKNIPMNFFFSHHDEDQPINLDNDSNFKYDVELLESGDLKRGTEEFEEQFRGAAALHMDTWYNFTDEDIEVHALPKPEKISFFALFSISIIFVVFALIIYVVIITWRRNLNQRYGARILLVTSCDDDEFANRMNNGTNSQSMRHLPLNPI